jgi:hypothetical protein
MKRKQNRQPGRGRQGGREGREGRETGKKAQPGEREAGLFNVVPEGL